MIKGVDEMTTAVQTAPKRKMNYRSRSRLLIHIILLIGAFVMIFPFVWMILTSFKSNGESLLIPPTFLPRVWLTENYSEVTRTLPFGWLYINTLLLMLLRIICALVFSSMAGFAFAKLRFPFKRFFFFLVLTQMMLPNQIFIIPQYQMLANMGQLNTIFALLFPGLARSSFGSSI